MKRSNGFLYPLGSLWLLLRCPVICPVYWESSASDTDFPGLDLYGVRLAPTVVDHGACHCALVVRSPRSASSLWSTGPPRIGIVERDWGRGSLQLISLLHCAGRRTPPTYPQPLPSVIGPLPSQRHAGHFAMINILQPPRLFPSKWEYQLSMFLNSDTSINILLLPSQFQDATLRW